MRAPRYRTGVAILLAALGALLPAPARAGQRHSGRLFPPQDLGLIEGSDREEWQKPEQIMDALGIAEGSVVADLGAGGGWFTIRLARRVGPNGRIYAADVQRQMIEAITQKVERENLTNVTTVLGTSTDSGLPPGLDVVLIVNAFHEMEQPVALLKNVARLLKPHGRIGIVDFTAGGGGPGPAPDQRVDPDTIIHTAAAAGLQLVARDSVAPFQYLLIFGRGESAR